MQHIVSFSGGKDSTAMLLRMFELNMRIDKVVFANTGKEFPGHLEYIKKVEEYIQFPITVLNEGDWDKWFFGSITRGKSKGKQRGWPLTAYPCWHSRQSKYNPLEKICKGNIRYLGYAVDEKLHRRNIIKQYLSGEYKDNYRFPLVDWGWTEQDCLDYLEEKDMVNPLYKKFNRLGCYLCPKQPIPSLRTIYHEYPELWAEIKRYDSLCDDVFNPDFTVEELEIRFKSGD